MKIKATIALVRDDFLSSKSDHLMQMKLLLFTTTVYYRFGDHDTDRREAKARKQADHIASLRTVLLRALSLANRQTGPVGQSRRKEQCGQAVTGSDGDAVLLTGPEASGET